MAETFARGGERTPNDDDDEVRPPDSAPARPRPRPRPRPLAREQTRHECVQTRGRIDNPRCATLKVVLSVPRVTGEIYGYLAIVRLQMHNLIRLTSRSPASPVAAVSFDAVART